MKRLIAIVLAGLLLGLVPAAQAEAKTFKTCVELRKTFKHGVSLNKSAVNRGAGPIFTPRVNAAVFRLNKKLDTDRDNIVCEVVRPKPKPVVVPTPTSTPETTATPTPSPSSSPTPPPKDLSQTSSISSQASLSDVEICKTSDLTPRTDVSNGFPRPANAKSGTVSARILYVPIIFSDLPFTESDLARLKVATEKVVEFYKATSYGKVSITYEFLPEQQWVKMPKSAADYRLPENIPQWHNGQLARDALALVDAAVDFNLYDGVVLSTGYSRSIRAGEAFPGMTFKTKNGVAKGVSFEAGSATGNDAIMAHELGHSLFGLEDLYVFQNPNRPIAPDPIPAGPWDMMSSMGREFFGWSKLLAGWLESSHVRCLTNQASTTHYIETIDLRGKNPKLVLVNLENGVTLAVEGRSEMFFRGVLVYKVDSRIGHGDGPISSEKRVLPPGRSLTRDGWTIRVVDEDERGFLIEILKG